MIRITEPHKQSIFIGNTRRSRSFMECKHAIQNATNEFDIRRCEKMVDAYIFNICPKEKRAEEQQALKFYLYERIAELHDDGLIQTGCAQ